MQAYISRPDRIKVMLSLALNDLSLKPILAGCISELEHMI